MRVHLAATLLFASSVAVAQDADALRRFDYDQRAPLDIQEVGVTHRGTVARTLRADAVAVGPARARQAVRVASW